MALRVLLILFFVWGCTESPKKEPTGGQKITVVDLVSCGALQACGLKADGSSAPCGEGTTCVHMKVCKAAVCINAAKACEMECGAGVKTCSVQESYPAQIGCPKK